MDGQRSNSPTGNWDTRISRRVLLRTGGSAAAGLLLLGRAAASASAAPPHTGGNPFSLGVASGDPTPDGFVLWTRLLPEGSALDGSAMKEEAYGVRYEIAEDEDFTRIVRRDSEQAVWHESHTVHAEIAGLQPDRWYWYRFKWGPTVSPVGRARTAPPLGAPVDKLRFAFASCQNWPGGYYSAYGDLAQQDLDLVVHLGDYIYEGVNPQPPRVEERMATLQPAHETRSLSDYRTRHALYKTDLQLQEAHRLFPWLATWDDHEVEDNYAGLVMNPEVPLETAKERRAAAYLAYWEHQPLHRSRKPVNENMPIFRRSEWGALASFHVIDTRQYRADQLDGCGTAGRHATGYCNQQLNPERQLMGDEQRLWLYEGLANRPTGSGWNVIANQVGFAPQETGDLTPKRFGNQDSWDGYAGDRQRLLEHIKTADLRNVVVITGDKHIHSVRNVPPHYDPARFGETPVATEFIGTSISSGGPRDPVEAQPDPDNPHHLWSDLFRHGYVSIELDADVWRSDYRVVETVRQPESAAWTATSWAVENGKPGAVEVAAV